VVLLELAENPTDRLNDISERVGISRRAAQMIVADLVEAGYVQRERVGRRNRYSVDASRPLRHRTMQSRSRVQDLLRILDGSAAS
jgi:DNA-binding MarR family transcriptional regulator